MKPNSIDVALNNYIGLRQQDIKPFFLLDAELLTVWRNDAAMKMPSPPDHWRERLQSSGSIQKWLRQLNQERFVVWDNLVENQIVLLTVIGIPTEQPYLELSLWPRHVITAEMPYDTEGLALKHSLDSGSFYSETAAVDTKDFYTSLCLAADRILNGNGVTIRLINGYHSAKTLTQPQALTTAFALLLSEITPFFLPGDTVEISIIEVAGLLRFEIQKYASKDSAEDEDECKPLAPDESSRPVSLAGNIIHWMGGSLTIYRYKAEAPSFIMCIPCRKAPVSAGPVPFYHEDILLRILSVCMYTDKLGPLWNTNNLEGNWNLFTPKYPVWGLVTQCIEAVRKRLSQRDYRDIYGGRINRNVCYMEDLSRLPHSLGLKLAKISRDEYQKLMKLDRDAPPELIGRIASFYGVTASDLEIPNLLFQAMFGTLPESSRPEINTVGFLVFEKLRTYAREFHSENEAFNACAALEAQALNGKQGIETGAALMAKYYFDQSIPVPQKIGNNLTLLRLQSTLALEQAARQGGVSPQKLAALERGDITNVTCQDLDRLCRVFFQENPPGLFIGGYILMRLWRQGFMEYIPPFYSALQDAHPELAEVYMSAKPYYELLDCQATVSIITNEPKLIASNESYRNPKLFNSENPILFFNMYRMNLDLWLDGELIPLARPVSPEGTMHLYHLERIGELSLFLAVFEAEGRTVDLKWFGSRIQQIQMR